MRIIHQKLIHHLARALVADRVERLPVRHLSGVGGQRWNVVGHLRHLPYRDGQRR
jgi:hypothetical protein